MPPTQGGLEVLAAIAGAPFVLQADDGRYYKLTLQIVLGVPTQVWVDLGTEAPAGAIVSEEAP